jgi:hypothetical protein
MARLAYLTKSKLFRRFQINFSSAEDASQFIDCIRPVCPCQSQGNTTAAPVARSATSLPSMSTAQRHATISIAAHPLTPDAYSQPPFSLTSLSTVQKPDRLTFTRRPSPSSSDFRLCSSSDLAAPPSSLRLDSSSRPQSASSECPNPSQRYEARDISALLQSSASLPTSTLPTSSEPFGPLMPPPPLPSAPPKGSQPAKLSASSVSGGHLRNSFVEELRKDRGLYNLSRTELETLVGQVLHEQEFVKLVYSCP